MHSGGGREAARGDRGGRRNERGAALVEFAIIFPLLATLLFGLFSGGLLMNRREAVTHAGREGARYGATVPENQCTPTSNCGGRTWAQLVRDVTVERSDGHLVASQVCVALVSGAGGTPVSSSHSTTGAACYADTSGDTSKRVQVQVTRPDQFDAIFVSFSVTLGTKATAKFEQ